MKEQFTRPDGLTAVEPEVAPMSELVRHFDWAATPLGPAAQWPENLKTTVRILLTSRFPMWMAWGPELTFLYNDSYARITLGKKHPWALGKAAAEVWSEIWSDIEPRVQRVMETGEASWDETLPLILERSGYREESYHTFSYSPLTDSDGRNAGLLCVVMEDTARVLGERQLASLGTLAASLVNANTRNETFTAIDRGLADHKDIPFALVYLFDEVGSGLQLVARSGIDPEHPAAQERFEIDGQACPWPFGELLRTSRAVMVDNLASLWRDRPSGGWDLPPERARLVPIVRKGQDRPAGVFIAALNPYRQLDANYEGYLDLLAGQIGASIANAEAYEQERRRSAALEDLDRAKTAFFSNVSHELRTPLTLILGPIEDALTSQTPPSDAMLEMLHRNALRLLKLVNGLLDFVRIEAGRLQASYEPTDLSLLTTQLASVFRSAVERAGLLLTVECVPLPEPVYVDREMWEKVVLNLLSNALKSTFEGEIRVSVVDLGESAELTVADTGTGIPRNELPHLFERFRRVEGARRRSHEGSGIGLALVKELVEMHGGAIRVQSALGQGTSFIVTVPYGPAHLEHGSVISESIHTSIVPKSAIAYVREALGWLPGQDIPGGEIANEPASDASDKYFEANGAKMPLVLLVDDNADMREYVRSLMEGRFEVALAENGRIAMEQIEKLHPDLVLTDVMMPEMDGFELLAKVRESSSTRLLPVIMLSARAGEEARIEGVGAGADDYLTKPFTARELVARVEAQLKMARLRKESMEQEAALTAEIRRARQLAWETLEHLPEAFCTFDADFRITYMNPAAVQLAARRPGNYLGEVFWDLYPMVLGTSLELHFRRAMEDRIAVDFEQYFDGDQGEFWFQFQIYPQPDAGLILYVRDTTAARRTEQALRRSEQLAAAGRLAASIAHEINNPLEAVTNLLYLAKMDPSVASNARNLLDVADKELQRLSHITARSLKFYRQRTAPALTSLEELIESVLFFHETELKMRGIHLERRFHSAPPVLCLAGEMQQVLTNVIGNGLEALENGGRLVLGVAPALDRNDHPGVAITIADTGCGMSRSTLDRLFHPFVTTKGEMGTGLGLWVSKGILDKQHSRIKVRSRLGVGTVFRIFVPLDATVEEPLPLSGE